MSHQSEYKLYLLKKESRMLKSISFSEEVLLGVSNPKEYPKPKYHSSNGFHDIRKGMISV